MTHTYTGNYDFTRDARHARAPDGAGAAGAEASAAY